MTALDWRVDSMVGRAPGYYASTWLEHHRWQARLYRYDSGKSVLVMEGDYSTIQAAKDAADKAMADNRSAHGWPT